MSACKTESRPGLVVVALGGNAILQRGQQGTADEQFENVRVTSRYTAEMIAAGWRVTLTHGNGPQVGNILLQNEEVRQIVPAMPLDVCGAESQGLLGYMFVQALRNELQAKGLTAPAVCLVTRVIVDRDDPAFDNPTKPVGPFYTEQQARRLAETKGYRVVNTGPNGWRRVVPSPDPRSIVDIAAIRCLVEAGHVVVACGGGGIPVALGPDGELGGVEAVIDKDLAGERLASELGADELLILTDVDHVMIDYGKPTARPVERLTCAQARKLMDEGYFSPGSMAPKIEACLRFIAGGGRRACIANLTRAMAALDGRAGTEIVKG